MESFFSFIEGKIIFEIGFSHFVIDRFDDEWFDRRRVVHCDRIINSSIRYAYMHAEN